ncbi:MAG: pentapeptide repeat-containing protein [Symploca sp. SIO2C1]|nr:pentapeptide repeat-containing protein [Symploca sp. SIO2C1]
MVYNQQHSYLVRLGASNWNNWRINNPNVIPILEEANLNLLDLSGLNLRGANLRGANLFGTDFIEADLTGADLRRADLTAADLTQANLTAVDLREARLIRTQALATNFKQVRFTGVCLEDWNIDSATNLDGVICDYVYLKSKYIPEEKLYLLKERRPYSGNFEPGEFTKLFQKVLEPLDLVFRNGIDWQSFLVSFQELQVEFSDHELSIQALESKNSTVLVIKINVPNDANKAEIEQSFKHKYRLAIQGKEAKLKDNAEQISLYRQQSADITEIVKVMANRSMRC